MNKQFLKKPKNAEWDKAAEWWDKETGNTGTWHQQHDINPVIFKIIKKIKDKKILEIGCGNGYLARLFAKKDAKVTAIDISSKLIDLALAREKTKPLGINYLVCDAANLKGIKMRHFDVVIANMCLMDIADAKNAIKKASQALKRDGHFIFSVNHPVFCDRKWIIIEENNKKYFARAVNKYLSSIIKKHIIFSSGAKGTGYHRSIETYIKYLRNANLIVNNYREIYTKMPILKNSKNDKGAKLDPFKYTIPSEKKMKEFAKKEIPMFLVIGAIKHI